MKSETLFILLILNLFPSFFFSQQFVDEKSNTPFIVPKNIVVENKNESKLQFLEKLKTQLPKDYKLEFYKSEIDELGYEHSRYRQFFKNILVENSMFIIHERNGFVYLVNGGVYKINSNIKTTILARSKCKSIAIKYFKSSKLKSEKEIPSLGELVWCHNKGDINQELVLCYKFELYSEKPLKKALLYVDAYKGVVIWEHNKIHELVVDGTAKTMYSGTQAFKIDSTSPSNFILKDMSRGNGIFTKNLNFSTNYSNATFFSNTSKNWIDTSNRKHAANDIHWGTQKVYDYFKNIHNRLSFDNMNATINSYAPYDINFVNAFWDGAQMTYGYGDVSIGFTPLVSLDVVGHEISHGVTAHTANLVYMNESGALNESFSDIFGKAIEKSFKPSTFSWIIGKEITISGDGIRNMSNPKLFQHPDTYLGNYWYSNNDVHINSSVQNHWFYILTEGKSGINDIGNSYNVSGIGINKAEKIAYRNLSVYLTPNSNYLDASIYAIQAANDLYGNCSNESIQTTNAWYAVGVGDAFSSNTVANFSVLDTNLCSSLDTMYFSNLSINSSSFLWNFGDGAISTLRNPSHKYATQGTYTVKLKVWNCNLTQSDSIIKQNYIVYDTLHQNCINTAFVSNSKIILNGCKFNIVDNGGNGNYANNSNDTIILSNPNVSKFNFTVKSFDTKQMDYLFFYNKNSNVPFANFDGIIPTNYNFTSDSNYVMIIFSSGNTNNNSGFKIQTSCITNPPTADFYSLNTNVCYDSVIFVNSSKDNSPNISTYYWDFGDGTHSSAKNPSHKYNATGNYTIKLKVCNSIGCDSMIRSSYIYYNNSLNSCATRFGYTTTKYISECNGFITDNGGTTGSYTNNNNAKIIISNNSNVKYKLNFVQLKTDTINDYIEIRDGDNVNSPLIGKYSGKKLPNNGNDIYTTGPDVYLNFVSNSTVVDSGLIIKYSCIELPPKITDFTASETQNCNGNFFFSSSIFTSYNFIEWDFGDGSTSRDYYPSHFYANAGSYTVKLKVCNNIGCDSMVKMNYITYDTSIITCANKIPDNSYLYLYDCKGLITDIGGVLSNYNNSSIGEIYLSSFSGEALKIKFLSQNIHPSDTLFIFDNSSMNLIGKYTGNVLANNGMEILTNTNTLKFVFSSDNSLVDSGFLISYSCYYPTPKIVVNIYDSTSCDGLLQTNVFCQYNPNINYVEYGDGSKDSFSGSYFYISHFYQQTGNYNFKIISCNSTGCDTLYRNFEYDSTPFFCATRIPRNSNETISYQCNGYIVDDGGYKKGYSNKSNGYLSLYNFGINYKIRFLTLNLVPKDTLYLYDNSYNLISKYFGNTLPNGGNFIETKSEVLYFNFISDSTNVDSGFLIEYSCESSNLITVDFRSNDTITCGGVQFENFTTNANFYYWDFGDGITSNEVNPYHFYNNAGIYSPILIACNSNICDTLTLKSYVDVKKVKANFYSNDTLNIGAITLNHSSVGASSFKWYLDNMYKSASSQFRTTISSSGNHTISLIASNGYCLDTFTKIIYFKIGSGISNFDGINNAKLYPNPSSGFLTLEIIQNNAIDLKAQIIDVNGQIVNQKSFYSQNGKLLEKIDVNMLSNGSYFLRFVQDGEIKSIPFIIKK